MQAGRNISKHQAAGQEDRPQPSPMRSLDSRQTARPLPKPGRVIRLLDSHIQREYQCHSRLLISAIIRNGTTDAIVLAFGSMMPPRGFGRSLNASCKNPANFHCASLVSTMVALSRELSAWRASTILKRPESDSPGEKISPRPTICTWQ